MDDLRCARDGYEEASEAARMLDGLADLVSAAQDLHCVGVEGLRALLDAVRDRLHDGLEGVATSLYVKLP
ncbi:hypothetical protein [Zavarzinia aquatilis]|uniref:Uncharacterized protein n=1 Tax=Zavarzinia aquatilis TaxID=2211142 RepID=A0A317DTG6_9PROT|nr:hypothetical protein [Zavarzinia aquatilis]PWR17654.1 hypothetical protein DKG74_20825 [Zavarzinia aquatilis]